jgi:hypothetical protein
MTVYRLDPIEGAEKNPGWIYCMIGASPCWVQAESAAAAREVATQGTIVGRRLGNKVEGNFPLPWLDPAISSCHRDDSREVAPGYVLTIGGNLLPVI